VRDAQSSFSMGISLFSCCVLAIISPLRCPRNASSCTDHISSAPPHPTLDSICCHYTPPTTSLVHDFLPFLTIADSFAVGCVPSVAPSLSSEGPVQETPSPLFICFPSPFLPFSGPAFFPLPPRSRFQPRQGLVVGSIFLLQFLSRDLFCPFAAGEEVLSISHSIMIPVFFLCQPISRSIPKVVGCFCPIQGVLRL